MSIRIPASLPVWKNSATTQGSGGTRIPNQGLEGGGVQPKAEKKKVTSPILMAEVVIDVPKGTQSWIDLLGLRTIP